MSSVSNVINNKATIPIPDYLAKPADDDAGFVEHLLELLREHLHRGVFLLKSFFQRQKLVSR